jgi:dihydropteroate synthase
MMQSGGIDHSAKGAIGASARDALAQPRCGVWGVLNVTHDSFSDGGRYLDPRGAIAHAELLIRQGATVIDIGGASSRPAGQTYGAGAAVVSAAQELDRVAPVIEALAPHGVPLSIDTTQPEVARAALRLGASFVNDVSCAGNPALLEAVAAAGASYVVMHSRGKGEVAPPNTTYGDVCSEVASELLAGAERAVSAGIARARIWLDPGIGFAKTAAQSIELLAKLERLVSLGYPVLVGASRKGFIAEVAPHASGQRPSPAEREAGSVAVLTAAVLKGALAVRVHEVAEARQAVLLAEALLGAAASTATLPTASRLTGDAC